MRTLTEDQRLVNDLVEVFTAPIVYNPGGWEDTIPDWMKTRVIRERLDKVVNGGWEEATDAEVACYLYTASLCFPLTSDWTAIYLFEVATLMPQARQVIPDIAQELNSYQMSELRDLKRKIRESQRKLKKQKRKEKAMSKRKVVLDEREGGVLVGVSQDGCDPYLKTVEGTLSDALGVVPQILEEAAQKWQVAPRNPAYKPPAAPPKPAPSQARGKGAGPEPRTDDLPLLAGDQKVEKPAEVAVAPSQAGEGNLPLLAGDQKVEKPAEVAVMIGEPPAESLEPTVAETEIEPAAEDVAPETTAEPVPQVETKPGLAEVEDRIARAFPATAEDVAPETAESVVPQVETTGQPLAETRFQPRGAVEYWLNDGRGPYPTVQDAMNGMGLDKATRPQHNRWDRLSTELKKAIQAKKKC